MNNNILDMKTNKNEQEFKKVVRKVKHKKIAQLGEIPCSGKVLVLTEPKITAPPNNTQGTMQNTAQNIAQNTAQNTAQNIAQNTAQNIAQNNVQNNTQNTMQNTVQNTMQNNGLNMMLSTKWVLWLHPNDSKSWTLESYDILSEIYDISQFWMIMNNFSKLDVRNNQFFLMRTGITPTWEDRLNRNGSTLSYRFDISQESTYMGFWIDMCALTCNEMICANMKDITGLSFTSKGNWALIKIWNTDGNSDLTNHLSQIINEKYPSQIPMHKRNAPEY